MSEVAQISERALEMRQAFDRSFAEPAIVTRPETEDVIAIRLGADGYGIRMSEIDGLHADVPITPCPGPLPELLGLSGFRGQLMPVYDLAGLMGYPAAPTRWMVTCGKGEIAFAFAAFDDHFRIPSQAVAPYEEGTLRHVSGIAATGERTVLLIDLKSIRDALRTRLPRQANKE